MFITDNLALNSVSEGPIQGESRRSIEGLRQRMARPDCNTLLYTQQDDIASDVKIIPTFGRSENE